MLVVKRQQAPFLGHIGHPTTRVKKNELTRESTERLADDLGISGNPRLACVLDYLYDAPTPEDIYRLVMFVYYLRTDRSPTFQITSQEGETLWMTKYEINKRNTGYTANVVRRIRARWQLRHSVCRYRFKSEHRRATYELCTNLFRSHCAFRPFGGARAMQKQKASKFVRV